MSIFFFLSSMFSSSMSSSSSSSSSSSISTSLGLNACVLGHRSRRSIRVSAVACCHGSQQQQQQQRKKKKKTGRRSLFSLLGILSSPSLLHAAGAAPPGQGHENARFAGEGTGMVNRKTSPHSSIDQLGDVQPISPLINIAEAETLLNGGAMMEETERLPLYLNTFGYMASAVLGSLLWYERQLKTSADETLHDLRSTLGARENEILALKQKLTASVFDKEETMELELQKEWEQKGILCHELESCVRLIDELKAKIQDYKSLIHNSRDQIQLLEGRIDEVERHMAGLEETFLKEKTKGADMEEQIKGLMLSMQRKENEVNEATITLHGKERDIARFLLNLNKKTVSSVDLQNTIEGMEKALNLKNREMIKNERSLEDVKLLLSNALARAAELEKEIVSVTIRSDALRHESLALSSKVQAATVFKEEERKLLAEKLVGALSTLDEKKATIVNLQKEIDSLNHVIREGEIEINNMQDVGIAKDKASSLSRELEELNQENARVEKQALAVGSKLEENLRTLKHALHQEEQASISLKDDIWKLNEVLDRSNNEVSSLREKLVRYKTSHDELRREAFEIAKNVKALELDIAKQRQVSNTSKEELDLAQNVIIELEKEEKLLKQDFDRARMEKDNLINKIFDLHEQLESTHIRVSGVGKHKHSQSEPFGNEMNSTLMS